MPLAPPTPFLHQVAPRHAWRRARQPRRRARHARRTPRHARRGTRHAWRTPRHARRNPPEPPPTPHRPWRRPRHAWRRTRQLRCRAIAPRLGGRCPPGFAVRKAAPTGTRHPLALPRARAASRSRRPDGAEKPSEPLGQPVDIADTAFPDDQHPPSQSPELRPDPPVASDIAVKLGFPEVGPRPRRRPPEPARVPMPEAPVHEDDGPPRDEHDVRIPGQIPPVQPIPIPHRRKHPPHHKLRPGVLPANGGHAARALFRSEDVHASRYDRPMNGQPAGAEKWLLKDVRTAFKNAGCFTPSGWPRTTTRRSRSTLAAIWWL